MTQSKRDDLDIALLQRKRQYFSKPGMICSVSFCQAWEDGSYAGFDAAIEEVVKIIVEPREHDRAWMYFEDLLTKIKSLREAK